MLRVIVSLFENQYVNTSYNLFLSFFNHVDDNWNEGYAYMALCCMVMKKDDEFMEYLKLATEKNPKEAKAVLSSFFPEGMKPQDYYEYMLNQFKTEE